ncbi:hypothetical protein PoB_005750500 [Plakobranchus ocellatus]|uniref:Uncharacterized protein n=1 Tax=Plakobranchus ocellatus TaxID=259542 RepID=A0AAV4CDZ5_9GAST|nr:hypothetical protein PoB_005750500 [Plakobranchus ocellatus]
MEVSLCVDSTLSAAFSEALGGWGASDSNRSVEEIEAARGLQEYEHREARSTMVALRYAGVRQELDCLPDGDICHTHMMLAHMSCN